MQLEAPPREKAPAGQGAHAVLLGALLKEPAAQGKQAVAGEAPIAAPNVPASQGTHAAVAASNQAPRGHKGAQREEGKPTTPALTPLQDGQGRAMEPARQSTEVKNKVSAPADPELEQVTVIVLAPGSRSTEKGAAIVWPVSA